MRIPKLADRLLWWAVAVYTLVCVIWQALFLYKQNVAMRRPAATDIDEALFLRHEAMHPTWTSTLAWWHGNWIDHDYPYYWRPLTMTGYWIEYHLFGPLHLDGWIAAALTFHVIFVLILACFAYSLTRSRLTTLLATLLFTAFTPFPILKTAVASITFQTYYNTSEALQPIQGHWEDQPEPWTGICILGMMMAIIGRRWWVGLALAVVAVCFKESGWIAFPLAGAMLIYTRSLTKVPKPVWIATAVFIAALIALRAISGHRVMFPAHDHSNGAWPLRYGHVVIDANLGRLFTLMWPVPLLGFALAAVVYAGRLPFLVRAALALCAVILTGAAVGWSTHSGFVIGLVNLADSGQDIDAVAAAIIYALVLTTALRNPSIRRLALLIYVTILLSALPSCLVLQPNSHMLYLTSALQSLLVATLTTAALRDAVLYMRSYPRENNPKSQGIA